MRSKQGRVDRSALFDNTPVCQEFHAFRSTFQRTRRRAGRFDRPTGEVAAQADRRSAGRASRSSHSFADSRGVDHPAVHVRLTGCAGYMGFEGPHAGRNSGEFKRIATEVCGIDLCEHFPRLVQRCQAQQRGTGRRPRSLAEVLHVGAGRWRHPPRSGQREEQRNFLWSRSSPVRGPPPGLPAFW